MYVPAGTFVVSHCIGWAMNKAQKSLFKALKKESHRAAFVDMLMAQQARMGKCDGWKIAYAKKCKKKGVKAPFDKHELG